MRNLGISSILRALLPTAIVLALMAAAVQAQLPSPNPLVAPVPAPSIALLAAPVSTAIAPSLILVPSPPPASPTPAVQAFSCSCYGYAIGTRWMGQVAAASFFAARQAATAACLAYNERKEPTMPTLVGPASSSFGPALTVPQGFEAPNAASTTTLPGGINYTTGGQLQACTNCACS